MATTVRNHVTLADIAARAGLSKVTVSKILSNTPGNNTKAGERTVQKVRRLAREMKYQPNLIARQLAGGSSKIIGVIVDSYAPQVYYNKLSAMEREAALRGYQFMVGQSHGEVSRIGSYALDFSQRGVEGIICLSHQYLEAGSMIFRIFEQIKNVVYINRPYLQDKTHDNSVYVDIDRADGICQAFDYLISKGRKRIALFLCGEPQSPSLTERVRGYLDSLTKHRIEENLLCDMRSRLKFELAEKLDEEMVEAITGELSTLIHARKVDAILAENDVLACILIKQLLQQKLRVPEDVAVVGFDNLQLGALYNPTVTTLDQRNEEQAKIAVNLLIDMIEGREVPPERRQVIMKPKLIIRESTG